jgi:hypothetical protein
MSQQPTFVERLRAALGHTQRLVPAPVADVVEPAQRTVTNKGQEFAERLRAAIPRQLPRSGGHL